MQENRAVKHPAKRQNAISPEAINHQKYLAEMTAKNIPPELADLLNLPPIPGVSMGGFNGPKEFSVLNEIGELSENCYTVFRCSADTFNQFKERAASQKVTGYIMKPNTASFGNVSEVIALNIGAEHLAEMKQKVSTIPQAGDFVVVMIDTKNIQQKQSPKGGGTYSIAPDTVQNPYVNRTYDELWESGDLEDVRNNYPDFYNQLFFSQFGRYPNNPAAAKTTTKAATPAPAAKNPYLNRTYDSLWESGELEDVRNNYPDFYNQLFYSQFGKYPSKSTGKKIPATAPAVLTENGGADKQRKAARERWDNLWESGELEQLKNTNFSAFNSLHTEAFGKPYNGK